MTTIKKSNGVKRSPAAPPKLKPKKRKVLKAKRARRRVKRLFADAPEHVKVGSPAFAKLQADWYKRLASEGFEDIEWHDPKSGYGQNSSNLKHSVHIPNAVSAQATLQWFRLWTNYFTWNHKNFRDKKDRLIVKLYSEGKSYRQISAQLKANGHKKNFSLYYVFSRLNHFKPKMLKFNQEHREGLLKEDISQDSPNYVVALIGDLKAPWLD